MTTQSRLEIRDKLLTALQKKPLIMGILNVTPDSFSDGGHYNTQEQALQHAKTMSDAGCAIIDVGGESTRPGATIIDEDKELARITPIIEALCSKLNIAVSIDTYKATVAHQAAKLGAVMINDIWGLQRDPHMANIVAETESAIVMMHNRNEVDPSLNIMDDICRFFDKSLSIAHHANIPMNHIILDPGVGFSKTIEQNLACIIQIHRLQTYGLPVLLGISRKSFIGHILNNEVNDRLIGTLAANMIGLTSGASILRVHDVAEHREALAIFEAIRQYK